MKPFFRVSFGAFVWIVSLTVCEAQAEGATNLFEFRFPHKAVYRIDERQHSLLTTAPRQPWLKAWPEDGSTNFVEFGSRVVLQLKSADDLVRLTAGHPLELSRTITSNLFILQAAEARTAILEARSLAALPEVVACYPVMQRQGALRDAYAQRSNDPFFGPYFLSGFNQRIYSQWPLENKDTDGSRIGVDLNVMAAWPYGSGQGVTVAVADTGVELTHPDLTNRVSGAPHFNFYAQNTNATPFGGDQTQPYRDFWTHATSVAGLLAAEGNNGRGMIGVAPQANLASWVIFATNLSLVSDEVLMDMYVFASNTVSIQNHSWGIPSGFNGQSGPTPLEQAGIAQAVTLGRSGLGTVMVRAAGNDRTLLLNADDDGYANDPQAIAVAAITMSGRATSYSTPGACLLVGAPGGGGDSNQGLLTLDLVGSTRGVNSGINYQGDLADYRWGIQGFIGTSGAAPLVSGVAALILSVNPALGYRDVQQILLLSARQWDVADPDLATNGAGLVVSHNVGFGVPDAGQAVRMAQSWSNRPPATTLSITNSLPLQIPSAGLRVEINGDGVPTWLSSIPSRPGIGLHADQPTSYLPLVDVDFATNVPSVKLTNQGALIERGIVTFDQKIRNVAQAGAAFAVIYNLPGDNTLVTMLNTDYSPIPAVFINNTNGQALKELMQTNQSALARIHLLSADQVFSVTNSMNCEQVGVRVQTDHPVRGDVRITLLSPQGTRSVLQRINMATNAGPADWTYWSTHHFFESSVGDWTVSVSDEGQGHTGTVRSATLIIRGTAITDSDHDGLDDGWEMAHFGSLAYGPKDDPDGDGFSNAREQVMGTDPMAADVPFKIDVVPWHLFTNQLVRLSWPSTLSHSYEVWGGTNVASLSLITNVAGQFPVTEWMTPSSRIPNQFFRVRAKP